MRLWQDVRTPEMVRLRKDVMVYPVINALALPRSLRISVAGVLPAALLLVLPLPESSVMQRSHVSAEQIQPWCSPNQLTSTVSSCNDDMLPVTLNRLLLTMRLQLQHLRRHAQLTGTDSTSPAAPIMCEASPVTIEGLLRQQLPAIADSRSTGRLNAHRYCWSYCHCRC